jgi:hypothetical protein
MHKTLYHQVAIDKKLAPLEVASRAEALEYRTELGEDNVDIFQGEGGEWFVQVQAMMPWPPRRAPPRLARRLFVLGGERQPAGWPAVVTGITLCLCACVRRCGPAR